MALGRRGIIFSFMALLAIGLLLLILLPQQTELSLDRTQVIRSRILLADEYVRNLRENYLPSALYVSSYRTLNALAIYTGNQTFFASEAAFQAAFKEALFNGSLGGRDLNSLTKQGLIERNLTARLHDLENTSHSFLAINTTFHLDYNSIKTRIYQANTTNGEQAGPWKVAVNVSFNYTVTNDAAVWNRSDDVIVIFSIEGLPDPLYVGHTKGNFTHPIVRTNFSAWDTQSFIVHVNNSWYEYDNSSPSFLQRFYNDTTHSPDGCCGIESFVPAQVDVIFKPRPEPGELNQSFVDCNYFGGRCVIDLGFPLNRSWYVTGVTNATYRFKVDQYRAFSRYNVSQDDLFE